MARNSSSTTSASQRSEPASSLTRPDLILSSRAASVMRKSVCGRAGLPGRSQSQTATRSGRPKTRKTRARSGDATRFVAISMALAPFGASGPKSPGDAERGVERVDQDLGHHRPRLGAGEVAAVVEVPVARAPTTAGRPASSRIDPLQPADVVAVRDEVGRQGVEQPRVRGRVGDREAVDRVDQPDSEVDGPDAVDEAAGEVGVVGLRQPGEEPLARVAGGGQLRPAERLGRERPAGRGVGQPPRRTVARR